MHQMTDFDGERFMFYSLLRGENHFTTSGEARYDITIRQTPDVFSNSPGLYTVYFINVRCFDMVYVNFLLNLL